MTTTEPLTQPLVSLATVIAQARGRAAANDQMLDPEYNWTPEAMADTLLDLDEQVYTFSIGGGLAYLITPEVAEKLGAFIDDFTTPTNTSRSAL